MAERNYLFIHCKSPLKVVIKCAFKKKGWKLLLRLCTSNERKDKTSPLWCWTLVNKIWMPTLVFESLSAITLVLTKRNTSLVIVKCFLQTLRQMRSVKWWRTHFFISAHQNWLNRCTLAYLSENAKSDSFKLLV